MAKAQWENDTNETIKRNRQKRVEQSLVSQRDDQLNERRAKLSAKLKAEQAVRSLFLQTQNILFNRESYGNIHLIVSAKIKAYEQEFKDIQDTPEAQLEKTKQRALALKERREAERKKYVYGFDDQEVNYRFEF